MFHFSDHMKVEIEKVKRIPDGNPPISQNQIIFELEGTPDKPSEGYVSFCSEQCSTDGDMVMKRLFQSQLVLGRIQLS